MGITRVALIEQGKQTDREIMLFIEQHFNRYGRCPKLRDILANVSVKSLDTIYESLVRLERDGYIVRERYARNSIKLTAKRMFDY